MGLSSTGGTLSGKTLEPLFRPGRFIAGQLREGDVYIELAGFHGKCLVVVAPRAHVELPVGELENIRLKDKLRIP